MSDWPLQHLYDDAKASGRWFWCRYQDMWFTPDELKQANAEGRFRWGPVNWRLRDPNERLEEIDKEIQCLQEQRELFKQRIASQTSSASS